MAATKVKASTGGKAGKAGNKFFIDFSGPANDGILDGSAFEKYLHDHIKVDNKAGQLGDAIKVTKEGEGKIWVTSSIPFSKRYLKYLSKRFLKRSQLRDWLRVVATSKQGFEIKFFNVSADVDEEEE